MILSRIIDILEKRNLKLISVYKDALTPITVKCLLCNSKRTASPWSIVTSKHNCLFCIGRKIPIKKCEKIGISKGLILLSKKHKRNLLWKCKKCKNKFIKPISNIKVWRGKYCKECKDTNKYNIPISINKAKKVAIKRGGKCLSKEVKNNQDKLKWKCKNPNHPMWYSTYSTIVNQGCWCPECSLENYRLGAPKLNKKFVIEEIKKRGGEVDPDFEYKGSNTKFWVTCKKCKKEHHFKTCWDYIKSGCWCGRSNKLENKTISFIKKIISKYFGIKIEGKNQKTFKALKGYDDKAALRFDWYCKVQNFKIAIEFNGPQHYEEKHYWHKGKNDYFRLHHNDIEKEQFCYKNNICFIKIPYWENKKEIKNHVFNKIKNFNRNIILALDPGKINFGYCAVDCDSMEIIKIGMLKKPIFNINNVDERKNFIKEIEEKILYEITPKYIIAERFQSRGRFRGASGEPINIMLGMIFGYFPYTEVVTAGTWKTAMRREYFSDVQEHKRLIKIYNKTHKKKMKRYNFEMENIIKSETLTEHECDALGMCLWKAQQLRNEKGLLWKIDDSIINRKQRS